MICLKYNLIIGNTYWFSIEPLNKTKQGARRFLYNNYQIGDFKLLSVHNGDLINQHASLYFRLYSKQNNYAFNNVPYRFTIENDYTKDINLVTEIQIYNGYIQDLTQSLFEGCPFIKEESTDNDEETQPSDISDENDIEPEQNNSSNEEDIPDEPWVNVYINTIYNINI